MDLKSLENIIDKIGFGKFHYILILICGILQSFDGIETLIITVLQPILKCEWHTTVWDHTFLAIGSFTGMMLGGLIMGWFSGLYGRKYMVITSTVALATLTLISSAAPTIVWVTILRSIIGAFVGGVFSSFATLFAELIPSSYRGESTLSILAVRPIGMCLMTIVYVTVVPATGWRTFLVITALPIVITVPFLFWLPKSSRFLIWKDRHTEAVENTNRIATINKVLIESDQSISLDYSILSILPMNYLSTTLITSFLWFVSGLSYFGIIMISTAITTPQNCPSDPWADPTVTEDDSCCSPVSWDNSKETIISSIGELIFIPVTILMINNIGRKLSIVVFNVIILVTFAVMNLCMPIILMKALLFVSRGTVSASFNVNYLYATEVFPTSVRSLAIGLCNAWGKLGAIIALYVINFVIFQYSFENVTIIFIFFNVIAFVAALMLPYETMNQPLYQTT